MTSIQPIQKTKRQDNIFIDGNDESIDDNDGKQIIENSLDVLVPGKQFSTIDPRMKKIMKQKRFQSTLVDRINSKVSDKVIQERLFKAIEEPDDETNLNHNPMVIEMVQMMKMKRLILANQDKHEFGILPDDF